MATAFLLLGLIALFPVAIKILVNLEERMARPKKAAHVR
jgi:hypothetical protein